MAADVLRLARTTIMGRRRSVLIVDNDERTRNLIAETLGGFGCEPCAASDFNDALALARLRRFDLLITSVLMGTMSGLDLAAEMRQADPALKIIYVSRRQDPVRVHASLHPGSDALVTPFTSQELIEKTAALLRLRWRRPAHAAPALAHIASDTGARDRLSRPAAPRRVAGEWRLRSEWSPTCKRN